MSNTTNSLGEPYGKYPPVWVADGSYRAGGKYDFGPADEQVADLMRYSPNAKFICMVDLNTPPWLSFILRDDSFNQLGRLCSDPEWRRVTAQYMRSFLAHMEGLYAGKIAAYVLSGGNTSEWYDRSDLAESASRSAAWRQELESLGLPPADVPGRLAREHATFDNLLRDPQADGDALRYIGFCARQVVDSINFFLKEARTVIRPEAEPGVFEITPKKQAVLDRHVRRPGRTALYLYAPGISDGKSLDTARVRHLTGSAFGAAGVNVVDRGGHRSVYIATGPDLTVPALKDIARKAGIHSYSEYEQPVYANSKFLAVHTAHGGIQKIRLPRNSTEVREIFSGRVIARNCTEFECKFQGPDTALFRW